MSHWLLDKTSLNLILLQWLTQAAQRPDRHLRPMARSTDVFIESPICPGCGIQVVGIMQLLTGKLGHIFFQFGLQIR